LRSLLPFSAALVVTLALVVAAAGPASARARASAFEQRVIDMVNIVRADHGVAPLALSRRLSRAAVFHSADLAHCGFLAHESSDGTPMGDRLRRFVSARVVGETIAAIRDPRGAAGTAVRLWLESPPHREIILSSSFASMGVGRRTGAVDDAPAVVITADFASR
jgi:uncharacterized protein YkwD